MSSENARPKGRVTRRDLLRISGSLAVAGAASPILAACGGGDAKPVPAASAASAAASASASGATAARKTLEQELAIPDALLEAARKEGKFVFVSSIDKDVAKTVLDVFKKRYPGITPEYQEGSEEVRTVRTLTEFKAGRSRIDVVMGIGGFLSEYRAAAALTPLGDLPAVQVYEPPYRGSGFEWCGVRVQLWGIGRNTDLVKDADAPKTWEDLVDPKWSGKIGVGDRPQLWVQQLWKVWGPDRTTAFLKKLFANKPQRRKEGLDASAQLLAAGEFHMYVPSAPYRIEGLRQTKAPVTWFSPEPISVAASELVIVQKSPSPNAARVFTNWFASQEGQATYSKADFAVPAHPVLRNDPQYLGMFASQFVGKQWTIRTPEDEEQILPAVRKVWSELWTA